MWTRLARVSEPIRGVSMVHASPSCQGARPTFFRCFSTKEDILAIRDEIAEQIVAALIVEIAPADRSRMARSQVADVHAYDELLRGLDH
jgi:AcrR family transcriptional regulator